METTSSKCKAISSCPSIPKPDQIHQTIALLTTNLISTTDPTGQYLYHLPDGRDIDTKSWSGWDWTHGIALHGLWNYYNLTHSSQTLAIITQWFDDHLASGTTKNVNTMAAFTTLASLYEHFGDKEYRPDLQEWATWAMEGLERTKGGGIQHVTYEGPHVGELWDDTLMMIALPLAKIRMVLGRAEWVEEAKRQFLVHVQFLFDRETGLWFHGWKFEGDGERRLGHNFARARWGRGNAWVTVAIVEFLEMMGGEEGGVMGGYLIGVLEMQCQALERLQTEEGMWRTLLDVGEEEGSYVEASATAGIAYGVLKAVRLGYVDGMYQRMAIRAVEAVVRRICEDGELKDVSFGTPMGHDLQHYLDIPGTTMPYGPAMAMMMLGEVLMRSER